MIELQHFSLYRSVLLTLAAFLSQLVGVFWWNHHRYWLVGRLLCGTAFLLLVCAFRSFGWL
jgi:hypothetical protein